MMIPPMVAGLDRMTPFLLSDVPGDVAMAVGGAFAATAVAAIVALWQQHKRDIAQSQANVERVINSAHATADAMDRLTAAIDGGGRPRARYP
jgi:hypothetical protein